MSQANSGRAHPTHSIEVPRAGPPQLQTKNPTPPKIKRGPKLTLYCLIHTVKV